MNSLNRERFVSGITSENPIFVQLLAMCPTIAVTTSAINGLGMGLATMFVMVLSNVMISLLRNIIPHKVRMPAYIVIFATFVTVIDFLLKGFYNDLHKQLGLFIPLIMVNCVVLGRVEAFASKNKVIPSFFDGLGMGLGFTGALLIISIFRELIGNGTIFDIQIMPAFYEPMTIFILAPGGFFTLAFIIAMINYIKSKRA